MCVYPIVGMSPGFTFIPLMPSIVLNVCISFSFYRLLYPLSLYSRTVSSVKDSVKKFTVAGSAGTPEVKRSVRPRGEKTDGAKSEESNKATESSRASSAKGEKPQPSK